MHAPISFMSRILAALTLGGFLLGSQGCPTGTPADEPPTLGAVSVDAAAQIGDRVTASGEIADGDGPVRLRIDWGDAGSDVSDPGPSRTQTLTHVYASAGAFTVTFTAVDDAGQSSPAQSAQVVITPVNQPPTLGLFTVTQGKGVGETVGTLIEVLDAENQVRLRIDWGDGQIEDGDLGFSGPRTTTHQYTSAGTFTITFTAIDSAGQSSASKTAQTTITAVDGIADTANSIVAAPDGMRGDPEGVAAPAAVTRITWRDSRGADRSVVLGPYLYRYDFTFDDNTQIVTRSANDDAYGHEGFGYVVSHNSQNGNSPLGKAHEPTAVETTVFTGGHHAIHRVELLYDRDKEAGGHGIRIPVFIEWLVATGRDHPVWAVTWRTGQAANPGQVSFDAYRMDVRGPYGSLNFDGAPDRNSGDAIGGVAWGDSALRFTTTDAPLTLNSPWTYDTPNTVNFTHIWTAGVNAEMGIVQTRTLDREMGYPDRVDGRERGSTSAGGFLDQGDCTDGGDHRQYLMPCVNGWPYQLMNFDWDPGTGKPADEATGTRLIAWGTPYGWLGASRFEGFDGSEADGTGDRSYATFIVVGPRCRYAGGACDQPGDVERMIQEVQALAGAEIGNVGPGMLVAQLLKGPGASQGKTIANGYNDTYAAYYLSAAANRTAFTFTPAAGPVKNPIFVVRNYTTSQRPTIRLNGNAVTVNTGTADSGAFVSRAAVTNELWVTINRTIDAPTMIDIGL